MNSKRFGNKFLSGTALVLALVLAPALLGDDKRTSNSMGGRSSGQSTPSHSTPAPSHSTPAPPPRTVTAPTHNSPPANTQRPPVTTNRPTGNTGNTVTPS